MYFILFYLCGSHNQYTERKGECFACSKQRAPGRKGLRDYGAVSGGRVCAAVVLSTR